MTSHPHVSFEYKNYALYGLNIRSNYPLPASLIRSDSPDITVNFEGIVPKRREYEADAFGRVWKPAGGDRLLEYQNRTGHHTRFLIRGDGSEIRITQSWPQWQDTLFLLLNPAMAAALSLQQFPVLHASSLVMDGGSILIMGESEAGKSTLSAALSAAGLAFHADDMAVLTGERQERQSNQSKNKHRALEEGITGEQANKMKNEHTAPHEERTERRSNQKKDKHRALEEGVTGRQVNEMNIEHPAPQEDPEMTDQTVGVTGSGRIPRIAPGYPRVKIRPDLPARLGLEAETMPVFSTCGAQAFNPEQSGDHEEPEWWMSAGQLPGGFYPHAAPMTAVFILSERRKYAGLPVIRRLKGRQAVMALTAHVYGRDWLNRPGFSDLQICSQIASRVPVFRVSMPDDLSRLRSSAEFIIREISGLNGLPKKVE